MARIRWTLVCALLLALLGGALPVSAQDGAALTLDEGGFGAVKNDSLAAGAEAQYTISLKAGDRVAMDLQGESDGLQVTQFAATYGSLELQSPVAFNYMTWAPEDGSYTVTVKNTGDSAAGFTLRVAVSPAPLPAKKILTVDADGQSVPVTVGEPFQVALDAQTADGYAWTLGEYDSAVVSQAGDAANVLLGTMPGAMSQQIFSFDALDPGSTVLPFTYGQEGAEPQKTYSVIVDVVASEGAPAEEPSVEDGSEDTGEAASTPMLPDPIKLDQGNVLVIPLAGNPSTGYIWQIAPSTEGVLSQRGDASYTSASDAPGAPGYEIFTFDAAGPGDVSLTFTYREPWDETTPPDQQFVLPFTVTGPPAAPAEPPAPVVVGEADNGGSVEVPAGGMLFVDLLGNPTTGYIWQITDKDDAVLEPADYAFQPSSDGIGAGGVEHFEFKAVAPGEFTLQFAQSRPWETDAEPTATYSITVKVVGS